MIPGEGPCEKQFWPCSDRRYPVIVTQVDDAVALTVGGSRPAIVVSSAMRDSLTADQFDAVVRHEAAHLANRHDLYLAVLCGVDLAFGLVSFALQHRTDSSAVRRRVLVLGLSTVMLVATSTAAADGAGPWRVLVMRRSAS